ncbi:MAG: HEAT repeat domain-containing protein [Desulfuromonadaceae bacterium]|nr:HEAT repeat domain-containing protein [Desulfuromonadaceae bacterium]
MSKPFDDAAPAAQKLHGKSVEELLLLIADNEKGYKQESLARLLAMGLEENYPVLELAVRDDDNYDLRNAAMEVLVSFGVESTPKLVKLLEDPNEEVRNFSAVMLGDIGRREAVGALIRALGDPDMNVRHSVAEALGKIGDRAAILPLVNSLKSDFWLQYAAISALGNIGDYQAAPYLLEILEDENWSGPVVEALCKIGDPRSLKPLADIIPQLEENLCAAVTKALVTIYLGLNENLRFKNSLVEYNKGELKDIISRVGIQKIRNLLVDSKEDETIEAAIILLGWLGEAEAINDFFGHLTDYRLIKTVESAIFSIGIAAIPYLQAALSHENDNVKIVALHSLRWMKAMPGPDKLDVLFSHADKTVQLEALEALVDAYSVQILPQLLDFFVHEDEEFCLKVADVLAGYPFESLRQFLNSMTTSEDAEMRRRAALLLGHLEECGDISILKTLVADQDTQVRKEAIKAAGMQKLVDIVPIIHQALADQDPGVKETAVTALAGFGNNPEYMKDILNMLGTFGEDLDYAVIKSVGIVGYEKAGAVLMEELQNKQLSNNLVYSILETLGKISYKPATELVIKNFLHHQDPDIRRVAVEALGSFCDQNSLERIEDVVHDPHWSVRKTALTALVKIAGPRETQLILDALHDNDFLVRKHAIITLGNLRDVKTISEIVKQLADKKLREFACEAILNFGRSALPYLHQFMKRDDSIEIRESIIDLVGKIGDSISVGPLMELLEDPNSNIRLAAIDSLAFCFDSIPLKKLIHTKNYDGTEEVKNRADLALKTIMLESY